MQSIVDEIWKDIVGYEGFYQVSNLGRIKACERTVLGKNQVSQFCRTYPEKLLSLHTIDSGYIQVSLSKDGVSTAHLVHRLVAQAFIPNLENKPEVNHKDRNKSNNNVDNLEWVTKLENMKHATANGWNPKLSRLGTHNSEYHNQRISETHKGKVASEALINKLQKSHINQSKCCKCLETGQKFISFAEAGRCYDLDPTNISESIRKHRTIKGKYTFERC